MVKPGYKQTEIGVIPEDWEAKQIGSFARICMCKRVFTDQTAEVGDIPFYKIGTFGGKPDAYISRALYSEYKNKYSYPEKGNVLISAAGTLGRTVVFDGADSYFQDSNIVWLDIDKTQICNEYLKHFYEVIQWAASEGSTISRLYNGIIESTYVLVPPLAEQQRIAEALSDMDELIASLEKLIEKKKAIKQGAMQELLTGKRRLPGFIGEWEKTTVGKVTTTSSGGTPSREVKGYYEGSIPWITTSELQDCRIYDSKEHITSEAVNSSSAKIFPKGTVLMAMYGATIGKIGVLEIESTTNQACCAMICNSAITTSFLYHYLYNMREYILTLGCGAGQPNISQGIVQNLPIVIPTPNEQEEICRILDTMDYEVIYLEKRLSKAKKVKQGLMQQLLTGKVRLV